MVFIAYDFFFRKTMAPAIGYCEDDSCFEYETCVKHKRIFPTYVKTTSFFDLWCDVPRYTSIFHFSLHHDIQYLCQADLFALLSSYQEIEGKNEHDGSKTVYVNGKPLMKFSMRSQKFRLKDHSHINSWEKVLGQKDGIHKILHNTTKSYQFEELLVLMFPNDKMGQLLFVLLYCFILQKEQTGDCYLISNII